MALRLLDYSIITNRLAARDSLRRELCASNEFTNVETYIYSVTHAEAVLTITTNNGTRYNIEVLVPYTCDNPISYIHTHYPELYI